MAVHTIKKGLNLPIAGEPRQEIEAAPQPTHVAVVAADYPGMRPTMHVQEGETVKRGQLLFEDKKTPGVRYTAPGAGKVAAINRGERRALQTIVIELSENERRGSMTDEDYAVFESFRDKAPATLKRQELIDEYRGTFANPYVAAARGYIDDVIVPSETRPRLINALGMLQNKRDSNPPKKHGNIPL